MRPHLLMTTPERLQQLEGLGEPGHWAVEHILCLTVENVRLQRQWEEAQGQIKKQEEQLEQWQRQAHRQAAPFRRPEQERAAHPARPGRKAGHKGFYRPKPDRIDEHLCVRLQNCPKCHGPVCQKRWLSLCNGSLAKCNPSMNRWPSTCAKARWFTPMKPVGGSADRAGGCGFSPPPR